MRYQWYDSAREALYCESGFVCCSMAQAIAAPIRVVKDGLALYATERKAI